MHDGGRDFGPTLSAIPFTKLVSRESLAMKPCRASCAVIVLNCEDIGRSRSPAFDGEFTWRAVEQAITYYEELGFFCHNVCNQATAQRRCPPSHLARKLVKCPVVDGCKDSDREFVLRLAVTHGCCFVDNWNYREIGETKQSLANKIEYIFDTQGVFVPLRSPS
uniref:Uncharacterized protein n=1 Tax=Noctiluca scintillans TaxID=2966 RepID=A0A7S1EVL8_NOCSC|mmetsp:Transcript_11159/g.30852  ORF Transcript_11159/g.30852 Transcript_11159/m.30852 type:complete len:164 (+) Transcript_11159:66-557(+)